jgi:hypothetical protein
MEFPGLPPLGDLIIDEPAWHYIAPRTAPGHGAVRLRVWTVPGGTGHLAVATELGTGVSVTNSIEDLWRDLSGNWAGHLILLEHYPEDQAFPDDGEHLDQVLITGREPEWRRVWPMPESNPRYAATAAWMTSHGRRILT